MTKKELSLLLLCIIGGIGIVVALPLIVMCLTGIAVGGAIYLIYKVFQVDLEED